MWVLQWGALGCVAVAALVARDRRLAGWFGAKAVVILVIFVAYNVWLRSLQMADQEESYGKSFSLGVLHLTGGLREYGRNYWKLYGPLAVGVVAILAWVIPDLWREKPGDRKTTFLILAFGLGFMASAIAIYIPWNSRLYRYMLTGVFGFNLVGGILLACMFEWLGQAWREQRWILLLIPVGVAVTLLPPLVLLLIAMVAAGLMLAQHYQALGAALATGMFASGFVYMLACTPALRKAVDQTYMNRERAGWDAAMFVMRQNARGHSVGYVGNLDN